MEKFSLNDVVAMLAVIYKKIDSIECKMKGSSRSLSMSSYLEELKREADKISII